VTKQPEPSEDARIGAWLDSPQGKRSVDDFMRAMSAVINKAKRKFLEDIKKGRGKK
jgi:hypothetical protein